MRNLLRRLFSALTTRQGAGRVLRVQVKRGSIDLKSTFPPNRDAEVSTAGEMGRFTFLLCACLAWQSVQAQDAGLRLATVRQCMSCHQIDQKRVGPAFLLIRDRFLGDPAAIPYLAQSIRQGGRGRWGVVPMPSQPQVTTIEAEQLAQWILRLTPEKSP